MVKRKTIALICSWLLVSGFWLSAFSSFKSTASRRPSAFAKQKSQTLPQAPPLIINEYLANPGTTGDANGDGTVDITDDEFVELVNVGNEPLDIGGFTISDALQIRFTFPPGKIMPAGESAVVFGGGLPTGPFGNAAANGLVFPAGGAGLGLNNSGDTITIKDNFGTVVDSKIYPPPTNIGGESITRSPDVAGNFVRHSTAAGSGGSLFSPGARINGSPFTTTDPVIDSISPDAAVAGSGAVIIIITGSNFQPDSIVRADGAPINAAFNNANQMTAEIPPSATSIIGAHEVAVENPGPVVSNSATFTVFGAIRINEYLADPPGSAAGDLIGDANGDGSRSASQDEFVEIVNAGSTPINISGFTISDADQVRFTFPQGKIIPAGEAAVVFGGGTPTGPFGNAAANGLVFAAGGAGLSLNNGGDAITVKDSNGATLDSVTFGAAEGGADQSITRSPDVVGNFVKHSLAAGSGGSLFSPGAQVNGMPFTAPGPIINSISPDSAVVGSGPVSIIITGSNFQIASQVQVDGTAINTVFDNANQLTAEIPSSVTNAKGQHEVRVENPGSIFSNAIAFTVISPLGINEFLADPPDGLTGDANGDGVRDSSEDEFIEIINRTNAPIDVGGFSVSDADSVRFTFPPGSSIPAGEAAIIFGGGAPTGPFGNAAANGIVFKSVLSLNNSGDAITLKDAANNPIEIVIFGAAEGGANQSLNRNPDGSGAGFALHSTIEESGGRLFSPGAQLNGSPFTVGPRIAQINPDRAPLSAAPFDISVQGSGFDAASSVYIDSAPVTASFVSASELIARVPANATAVAGDHRIEVRNEGGNRSNPVALRIIPPPPSLSSLLPKTVPMGAGSFNLFAMGESFTPASVVLIEGSAVATVFLSSRELKATVPASFAATTGARRVKARNGDGQESSEMFIEIVAPAARITILSPAQTIAGGPSFTLVVRGGSFKSGATAIFDNARLATKFISASELQAEVPASLITSPGLRVVTAQNANGEISNEAVFQVLPNAPLIHSIDPATLIEGAGETMISVAGERFQTGTVARIIESGQPGAHLETKFITSERLELKLPARFSQTAGSLSLIVENPDFGFSNNAELKILIKDPLVINEFLADPPDGSPGDANGDGSRSASQDEFVEIVNRTSEPFDLSGCRLSDADETRHVFAPGTILPPFEATVVFGGGKPARPFGNAAENRLVFTASTGGLSLGNGGDTIRLEDKDGRVYQEIKYAAAQGGANQSVNRNPDGGGADFSLHTIVAQNASLLFSPGAKVSGAAFTVKPAINAFAPSSVRAGGPRFKLTISGSNFLPGAIALFDKTELATDYRSDQLIETEVSAGLISAGGAVELRVRNPKGELSASAKFIIADDPPRALKATPPVIGTGAENIEITIDGERFQPGAKAMIAGEATETKFVSKTSLAAVAPAKYFKAAGALQLRVMNPDGNQSAALTIAVENGPLITRLSRKRIKAGAGAVELTIGGVAFKADALLFVNDAAVPTEFVSENSLVARLPAELTSKPGNLILQARHANGGRSNKATLKVVD
jgi:lamin tail-like protein/IPT/TIG domain-containing protein